MVDRYAGERYSPRLPTCGKASFSLHFDGKLLRGSGSNAAMLFSGVSGREINGKFDYSVARQSIPNEGPIPEGDYWIQPSQLQENSWYRLRNPRMAWGNYWITIHPYPSTQTYKRGGFFIHGGSTPGSAGCIDLTGQMDRFVEALKKALANQPECYIPLTVRYPK